MKKFKIFGKSISVTLIALLLLAGIGTAALLTVYGTITRLVTVDQSVTLTGGNCADNTCSEIVTGMFNGDILNSEVYTMTNLAGTPRTVGLETSCLDGSINCGTGGTGEVTTTYLKELGYSFANSQDVDDVTVGKLVTTVTEDGEWMVWTFDFPVEDFTGDGNLNVGLIIATDGEGNGPAFQIHNNDGADASHPWGTWLMSPWGPTIIDGWNGWHSGDTNTLVTSLSWVEAIGQRNTPWQGLVSGDGVMEIRIKKSELGESFHWAASPTVGSGFYAPAYDVTMQIPTAFGWDTPLVTMATPNYVSAELMGALTSPVTLQCSEALNFVVVNTFAGTGQYTITTGVVPV